eukprot:gene4164-5213_t
MNWISQIPVFWGSVLVTVIYAASLVVCFPGTPINLAAGFLFGPILGSVATVLGCDLGAIIAFVIGRTLMREWTENLIKSNQTYGQIDTAVAKNGFLIIFLLRLSPLIPFGICNYLFGATKVAFFKYWLATTAGLIPCTVAYTYLGSLMRNLSDIYSENTALATIFSTIVIVVITIVTKRTLKKAMEENKVNTEVDLEKGIELPLMMKEDMDMEIKSHLIASSSTTEDMNELGLEIEVVDGSTVDDDEENDNDKTFLIRNTRYDSGGSGSIINSSNTNSNGYIVIEPIK